MEIISLRVHQIFIAILMYGATSVQVHLAQDMLLIKLTDEDEFSSGKTSISQL